MPISKSIQFHETETHYLVRRSAVEDGKKIVTENAYPKTEEGLEAAWDDYGPIFKGSKKSSGKDE
jgi:hypothetical protein